MGHDEYTSLEQSKNELQPGLVTSPRSDAWPTRGAASQKHRISPIVHVTEAHAEIRSANNEKTRGANAFRRGTAEEVMVTSR